MRLRAGLLPIVNLGAQLWFPLFFAGIVYRQLSEVVSKWEEARRRGGRERPAEVGTSGPDGAGEAREKIRGTRAGW